ncbi:hypothetical protein TRFO_16762 [Tritrichomonas foetus]|uniref:VPS9 domain-containing protein n=1 Tax=Tritrichomonas foetus TaxID=1144522 RepID=A0A1J4KQK8_9EUKA|nr:hypothetical protein TRFO_16762 [Tritrichomonas foetus]|eukprot:OHT13200.1 hypothetical protein TRFO_16762 [Tritrichomonas foetus]
MIDEEIRLSEWLLAHENLVQYLEPLRLENNQSFGIVTKFRNKREAVHNRIINILTQHLQTVRTKKNKLISKIITFSDNTKLQIATPIYSKQSQNMSLHKLSYISTILMELNLQLYSKKLAILNIHQSDAENLINFFSSSNLIPKNVIFRLYENFLNNIKPNDKDVKILKFKAISVHNYLTRLKDEISKYPKPIWLADFPIFFSGLLSSAMDQLDQQLSYVQPLESEVSLSRYIYSIGGEMKEKIEKTAHLATIEDPQTFVISVIKASLSLVPDISKKSPYEQSLGLMFFYRIIFDRVYELYHKVLYNEQLNNSSKMFQISKIPLKKFHIPIQYDEKDGELSIREFFIKMHFFHESSHFLDETLFVTNPVDAIYFVHRSLLMIHKAALLIQVDGEATVDDVNRLLSFDDLFSLLVGVLLASDIPNFFQFADYIQKFIPDQCLSNSFEYAQSAIKALILYLTNFDVDNFGE